MPFRARRSFTRGTPREIVPDAPVLTSLDIQAPWLDEMRNDKKNGS